MSLGARACEHSPVERAIAASAPSAGAARAPDEERTRGAQQAADQRQVQIVARRDVRHLPSSVCCEVRQAGDSVRLAPWQGRHPSEANSKASHTHHPACLSGARLCMLVDRAAACAAPTTQARVCTCTRSCLQSSPQRRIGSQLRGRSSQRTGRPLAKHT